MPALVDTGSPVSIVFIHFLLKVIQAVKGKERRNEEFKQLVMRTVELPTVAVQNYVKLDFLLGADLLASLGFNLTCEETATNLLGSGIQVCKNVKLSGDQSNQMPSVEIATVTTVVSKL